jgi:hypothetical protein
MDERYRQIYDVIYSDWVREPEPETLNLYFEQFGHRPPDMPVGSLIDDAVTLSARQRKDGAQLREDAKALLAVNFLNLVFVPLVAGGVSGEEVGEDVRRDMSMLVSDADAGQSTVTAPEITGHAVIDSVSRNWGNLRISRFNLWERS